jgi:transmembrane sensor
MLRREAADWLARLQGDRDPDVERKFEAWRTRDPAHAAAFDRMRGWYDRAGVLRHSPVTMSGPQGHAIERRAGSPRPALAAAAALVILAPLGLVLYRNGGLPSGGTEAVMLMTNVGEIKQVDLADGSKVTLDTATKVEVEVGRSHRTARLKYGRARFQVARADEPFVVQADGTTVSTRQGVIDVEEIGQNRRVDVLAGAAEVRGPNQAPGSRVGAGHGVTVGAAADARTDMMAPASDWTRGMLQFDRTPLADAVELANRYSNRHIVIDDGLGALHVTGAFRAGDTVGLARALAEAFGLSVRQRPDGSLILSRSPDLKKTGG